MPKLESIAPIANQTALNTLITNAQLKVAEIVYKELEVLKVEQGIDKGTHILSNDYFVINARDNVTGAKCDCFVNSSLFYERLNKIIPVGSYTNLNVLFKGSFVDETFGFINPETKLPKAFTKVGFNVLDTISVVSGKDAEKVRNMKIDSKQTTFDFAEMFGREYNPMNEEDRAAFLELKRANK